MRSLPTLPSLPLVLAALLLPQLAEAVELDRAAVLEAVETAARRSLPPQVVEIELHSFFLPQTMDVPADAQVDLRVRAGAEDDWIGRTQLELLVSVDGEPRDPLRAWIDVVALVDVPVLAVGLTRGEIIGAEDLSMTRKEADRLPSGVLADATTIVGRRLRRDLGLNSLLRATDLEIPVDAQRNRPVTLRVGQGSLTVSAAGVLRQDAHVGDLVPVWTPSTGKTVHGILTSPDLVVVPLANGRLP